jgi:hypothetical protein
MRTLILLLALSLPALAADDSLLWVHAGVATQIGGNFADIATSWKQPEATAWLTTQSGPYAGRFYRTGIERKLGLSAGITAVSYAIAWKWPRTRKWVGLLNMVEGGTWGAVAASNYIRNPYFR